MVARAPLNIFDEGLYLTMARFAGLHRVAYRDFWTLYGPGTAVIGPIVNLLFGRDLLAQRFAGFLVLLILVAGIYRLAFLYANCWVSVVVASAVGTVSTPPHHFTEAFASVTWGLVFVHGSLPADTEGTASRLWLGFALIGLSFFGRYEFSLVSALLLIAMAIYLRPLVDRSALRRAVLAGMAPSIAFLTLLLLMVPGPTLSENFIRYPFSYYAKAVCRGLPTPWRESFSAVVAPLHHGYWNGRDIVLIFGNFLSAVLGIALVAVVLVSWRHRKPRNCIFLFIGLLDLTLFFEMRPRSGGSPAPAVPFTLVSVLILTHLAGRRQLRPARWAAVAFALALAAPIVTSTKSSLRFWTDWPAYDRVLGFTSGTPEYNFYAPSVLDPIRATVNRYTRPHDPIFVALRQNRGHFANAAALYWVLDRPPVSRFIEFDPCLTDRNDVQRRIIADLWRTDVVVESSFFPHAPFSSEASVLDDYLSREFALVKESLLPSGFDEYFVLVRRTRLGSTGPR